LVQWDNGEGIGKMQVSPETDPTRIKTFKEVTYGEFCQKAKLSEDIVNKALRDANFMLSIDQRNFVVPVKTRKVRGRPAKKLVEEVHEDVSLDAEDKSEVEPQGSGDEDEPKVECVLDEVEEQEPKVECVLDEESKDDEEPKDEHKEREEESDEPEEKPKKLTRPRVKKPKAEGEPKVKREKKAKEVKGTLDGVGTSLDTEQFEEE
jgi:outer membrane biosynthesis protein TonB